MHKTVSLFTLTAAIIVAAWWWLGAAVEMPPSPLDPGEKLYCVSYAPFRGAQSPLDLSTRIEPWQIEQDLAQLSRRSPIASAPIRSTSASTAFPKLRESMGSRCCSDCGCRATPTARKYQIDTGSSLAKRFPDVDSRGHRRQRGAAARRGVAGDAWRIHPQREVAGADAGDLRRRLGILAAPSRACERRSISSPSISCRTGRTIRSRRATPPSHVDAIRKRVVAGFPGKEIVIGEVGWPSAGRMREGALPSPANQARVLADVLARGKREEFPRQSHRGVRSAVEAHSRRHGRRPLGPARRRRAPAKIRLGRAGLEPSALAAGRPRAAWCWRRLVFAAADAGAPAHAACRGAGLGRVERDCAHRRGRRRAGRMDDRECADRKPRHRWLAAVAVVRRCSRSRRRSWAPRRWRCRSPTPSFAHVIGRASRIACAIRWR